MNRAWFIYYGYKIGMSRQETLRTKFGEFMDLLDCDAITRGDAKYKKPKMRLSEDDLMKLN